MARRQENKADALLEVLNSKDGVDLWALRELALTEGGLVNDDIRRIAWPLLLGAEVQGPDSEQSSHNHAPVVPCSDDFEIIKWDAARSWHLLSSLERAQTKLLEHMRDAYVTARIRTKRRALVDLVNALLMQDAQDMFYYQGLHELASVILTVLSPELGRDRDPEARDKASAPDAVDLSLPTAVLSRLAKSHWMELLKGDFSQLEATLQLSLLPLLSEFDPEVHDRLNECSIHPSFFVSWIVTWFSHDVQDSELAKRLFDFFIVSHPLMPVYVTVAILTHRRNRTILLDEYECSDVFSVVRDLPKRKVHEAWDGHRSVSDTDRDDPFSESDSSAETDSSCSMDDRSRAFASLENALHSIKLHSDVHERKSRAEDETSTDGTSSHGSDSAVPFQEILDLALAYMEHAPPAQMLELASQYFGSEDSKNLVTQVREMSMFQIPGAELESCQSGSLDPVAAVALGYGHLLDKKRFRKQQRRVRSLEFLACMVFVLTLLAFRESLHVMNSVEAPQRQQIDLQSIGEIQGTFPEDPVEASSGSKAMIPVIESVFQGYPVPSPPPHMAEFLSSASRMVMDSSVSIYVRTQTSEIVSATWNATTNAVMRGLESEPLLDLDMIEPEESPSFPRIQSPSSNSQPNATDLCLNNLSWAHVLLSSQGSMSVVYCLAAAAAANGGKG